MNPKDFSKTAGRRLEEMASSWQDCTDVERGQALALGRGHLQGIVQILSAVGERRSPESMAIVYIKLKSEWMSLNTTMNYQLFHDGRADPVVMLTGSLIWCLIDELEPQLRVEDIDAITAFLAHPILPAGVAS